MREFLESYLADLRYQFDVGGIDYLNANSSGTPEFKSDSEFLEYMAKLKSAIEGAQ